ncbi:MAG TPA: PAS domain-containing protein, partial [Mycobacterium sp.]|nr:PAS domain-containing protein [Mycobacterium sp.]
MTDRALPADLAAAVELGGEMGRRFAQFDWAAHPLGPPRDWPVELRTTVAVALTTRFPIVLWLGAKDLFLVYNDAYIPMLRDKHPAALGRPGRQVWWDIWDSIGPMLTGVLETGTATWSDDLMLTFVNEQRYFTFSYSPLIGNDGAVQGIFCAVSETTERVLGQRRLQALNAAATAVMDCHTIADAVAAAIDACAAQPADLPFVAVYVDDPAAGDITLRGATPAVLPMLPRSLAQLTDRAPARSAVHVVDDLTAVIPGIEAAFGDDCPRQAMVVGLGAASAGGGLVIGTNPRRPLDRQYRGFCQLLAEQLSSALASAVSYDQQRQR